MDKSSRKPDAVMIQKAAEAMQSLLVIYNTALVYQTTHSAFDVILQQKVPAILGAVGVSSPLHLNFGGGEVRCGVEPLLPGGHLFRPFVESMERLGVRGLLFQPGLSADDLRGLIQVLTARADAVKVGGLDAQLRLAGVRHIREEKFRYQIVPEGGRPASAVSPSSGSAATAPNDVREGRGGSWVVGLAGSDWIGGPEMDADAGDGDGVAGGLSEEGRLFQKTCSWVLDEVAQGTSSSRAAARKLADEFDRQLNGRLEDIRRGHERTVQRLSTVKEIVLKEMDNLGIAAIVVNGQMEVLARNRLGQELLKEASRVEAASSLGQFIRSGRDQDVIDVDGRNRKVHVILMMSAADRDNIMLVCVD